MRKIIWYLRQCLPLTYRSHYTDWHGECHFAVWRMWFGRVFAYEDYVV